MLDHIYNKKNCSITKQLLTNCAKKSNNLDECNILKFILNKYCRKDRSMIPSSK